VEIACSTFPEANLFLIFEMDDGKLFAEIAEPGWLPHVSKEKERDARTALIGLYKTAGADMVRSDGARDFGNAPVTWQDWLAAWDDSPDGASSPANSGVALQAGTF